MTSISYFGRLLGSIKERVEFEKGHIVEIGNWLEIKGDYRYDHCQICEVLMRTEAIVICYRIKLFEGNTFYDVL